MKSIRMLLVAGLLCVALSAGYPAIQMKDNRAEVALQAAIKMETIDGNLKGAIEAYRKLAQSGNRPVAAQALMRMGQCYENLGAAQIQEARKAYDKIVADFADQKEAVAQARARLAAIAQPQSTASSAAGPYKRLVYEHISRGSWPTISPDGRYAVFSLSGGFILVREMASGHEHSFAPNDLSKDANLIGVAVSPDSRQLAYAVLHGWGPKSLSEICIAAMDGANPRVVASQTGGMTIGLEWAGDGKRLLGISVSLDGSFAAEPVAISIADGSIKRLGPQSLIGSATVIVQAALVSPDERYLATAEGSTAVIYVLDFRTGAKTQVTEPGTNIIGAAWTPDSRGLVFISDRTGTNGLWFVRMADGRPEGPPELLKSDITDIVPTSMSNANNTNLPNVTNLAVPLRVTRNGSLYYAQSMVVRDRYLVTLKRSDGTIVGNPVRLPFMRYVNPPSWSPDGSALIYGAGLQREDAYANDVNKDLLVIRTLADGRERVLSPGLSAIRSPKCSPDGKSAAVFGNKDGVYGIYRIDLTTGNPTLLVKNTSNPVTGEYAMCPFWSHDGTGIYFGRYESGKFQIVYLDFASGKETERYSVKFPAMIFFSDISVGRDGSICFMTNETDGSRSVVVVPPSGGEARIVMKTRPPNTTSWVSWAADGKSIWSAQRQGTSEDPDVRRLIRIPLDGSEPLYVGLTMSGMDGPTPSPDGSHVLLNAHPSIDFIWAIDNIIPSLRAETARPGLGAPISARRVLADEGLLVGHSANPAVAVSPDGRYLVFPATDSAGRNLAIQDLTSGERRRLVIDDDGSGAIMMPGFSPDGRRIAFQWIANDGRTFATRVIDIDGTNRRTIRSESWPERVSDRRMQALTAAPPTWSPDGTYVLVSDLDGETNIRLRWMPITAGAAERPVRAVLDLRTSQGALRISSDGRYAIREASGAGQTPTSEAARSTRLFVLDLATGTDVMLLSDAANAKGAQWTADGKAVLFLSDRGDGRGLWRVRIAGGRPQGSPELVKANIGPAEPVGVTRLGTYYYCYMIQAKTTDLYMATLDPATSRLIQPPVRADIRSLPDTAPGMARDWSPDSKYFVYLSKPLVEAANSASGNSLVVIHSIADGRERTLNPGLTSMSLPRWSPDGRSILVGGTKEGDKKATGLWRVDAETGSATLVASGAFSGRAWSPDGKGLYFMQRQGAVSRLLYRDLATGVETDCYRQDAPLTISSFHVSPDGTQIAALVTDAISGLMELRVFPSAGGAAQVIFSDLSGDLLGIGSGWTTDGKAVLAIRKNSGRQNLPNNDGTSSLWHIPIDGSAPTPTGLTVEGLANCRLSPDGSRLLFPARHDTYEVWALETAPQKPAAAAVKKK